MISASPSQVRERASHWQAKLAEQGCASALIDGESAVGGGSLPGETLPTTLLSLAHSAPDQLAMQLRQGAPAIVGRIQRDTFVLDPRTVLPDQEIPLLSRLVDALGKGAS